MKKQMALGIDIGGTNTKMGLVDVDGTLVTSFMTPTLKDLSPEEFISSLQLNFKHHFLSAYPFLLEENLLLGIGVGAPMANYLTGSVSYAPNLNWSNVSLKKIIEQTFHLPTFIENDANLAALGEQKWGIGQGFEHFILLTLGTGVGTGLILNGKLHRGLKALGGEGGHLLIPHHKKRICSCGGENHLECYLSAKGILQTIQEEISAEWTLEELGRHFKNHHPDAEKIMKIISFELARALSSMAVLCAPEAFIIGGGISLLGENFIEMIKEQFNFMVHYSLRNQINILTAKHSSQLGAIYGGAALIMDECKTLISSETK